MKNLYMIFFLWFTSMGYAQLLPKDTIDLKETVLYDKSKFKLKRFGPDSKSKTILVGLKADLNMKSDLVPQIVKGFAVFINAPKKEYNIEQLNFNFGIPLDHPVQLKVDLVEQLEDSLAASFLNEPILLTLTPQDLDEENVYHLNLRTFNLKHKAEFYIYVELMDNLDHPTYFSGAIFSKCFYQPENEEKWYKVPLGISPSINADLLIRR